MASLEKEKGGKVDKAQGKLGRRVLSAQSGHVFLELVFCSQTCKSAVAYPLLERLLEMMDYAHAYLLSIW